MRNKRIYGRIGLVAVVAMGLAASCFGTTPTLAVTPSATLSMLGQPVTLTATVSPGTGKVTFFDGTNVLGVATLSGTTAALTTTQLPAGAHSLTAYYGGDMSNAPGLSSPVTTLVVQSKSANAFIKPVNYSKTLDSPVSVAIGVFGTSTFSSLVVANYDDADVSVLLGNGNGTFQAPVTYAAGTNPHAVVVGDFDGDGFMDLAVANSGGTVSILLGKSDGTFQPKVDYDAGVTPYSIAVADFNKDGFADLAVVNDNAGVSILLGNGDGTFKDPLTDTDVAPTAVVAADFDGDGKPDLALTTSAGGVTGVSILFGDGLGGFGAPASYVFGSVPYAIAVGDFNGDTVADLAVTDYAGKVWVLLGIAGGAFNPAVSYPVGMVPAAVAVGDFDGDGKLDLVVTNSYSNTISILLGNGLGVFHLGTNYNSYGIPCSVAVGEFNGDERTDIAVTNFPGYGSVSVFLSDKYTISPTSGGGQTAKVNSNFAQKLVATVKNSGNTAVVGAAVTFTAPAAGASATFNGSKSVTVNTVSGGLATTPVVKAVGTTGSYPVTATVGFAGSTTFTLHNN